MPFAGWTLRCTRCGRAWTLQQRPWRCRCGGLLDLVGPAGVPLPWEKVSLSEPPTPLEEVRPGLWLKRDYELPTGSFKARGASWMMGLAVALGVEHVVVDSSGNAGKAAAAYAAEAGIAATVFVPSDTAPAKVEAISSFGAEVVPVPGDRSATALAAQARLEVTDWWYASHVYQPAFHHGVKTLAAEIHEQLGPARPGTIVVPAGNGTLVIGLWLGFREFGPMPRLIAVQSERCAPLAGLAPFGSTAAVGIAIPAPPRAAQVRAAVLASGGRIVTVPEADLEPARRELADLGYEVEPTAATVWAAVGAVSVAARVEPVVLVLTGR